MQRHIGFAIRRIMKAFSAVCPCDFRTIVTFMTVFNVQREHYRLQGMIPRRCVVHMANLHRRCHPRHHQHQARPSCFKRRRKPASSAQFRHHRAQRFQRQRRVCFIDLSANVFFCERTVLERDARISETRAAYTKPLNPLKPHRSSLSTAKQATSPSPSTVQASSQHSSNDLQPARNTSLIKDYSASSLPSRPANEGWNEQQSSAIATHTTHMPKAPERADNSARNQQTVSLSTSSPSPLTPAASIPPVTKPRKVLLKEIGLPQFKEDSSPSWRTMF